MPARPATSSRSNQRAAMHVTTARQRSEQPAVAADRVGHAHRLERDEEAGVRVGDHRLAAVLLQLLHGLRRLPLRARQIERVAILGGGEHVAGKCPDIGGRQVLHLLERQVHALGADHLEAVRGQMRGQRIVVALGIGRGDRDAARADMAKRLHAGADRRGRLDLGGGLDVADDHVLVARPARHHERPAAVNDEIDAARSEIGRGGGDLGEALLELLGPPVVDAAGHAGQADAVRREAVELVRHDLDDGRRDIADAFAPTEHACLLATSFPTRLPRRRVPGYCR